jgi:hypothetical protein
MLLPKNSIYLLLVLISVSLSKPKDLLRLEGLGKVNKTLIDLIESRTCDLPACSILPQLLTCPSAIISRLSGGFK